jgi:hypothetical protein
LQEIDTTSQKKLPPLAKQIREIRTSCRHFPEFADVFTGVATLNKEIYIYTLLRLGDAIRWKRPEKWKANSWFRLLRECSSPLVVVCQGFLSEEQYNNTGTSLILS